MRATLEDNQLHASTDNNIAHKSYLVNTSWSLRFTARVYPGDNNNTCTCLTSNTCVRPQGFYCRSVSCQMAANLPNQTIPGLRISCFPINSVLLSTLECFYNASCIQMLLDWRLFEIADIYRPLVLNVTPLNPNLSSRYAPTTTLDVAISRLLIEDWKVTTNVAAHYDQCKPSICTYTYVARLSPLYVVTSVLGLLGGLSVVLRLTVPVIVRIIMQKIQRRHQPVNGQMCEITSKTNDQNDHKILWMPAQLNHINLVFFSLLVPSTNPTVTRPRSLFQRTRTTITGLDAFVTQVNHSLWATWTYLSLLVITFFIILLISAFNQQTSVHTVQLPSESTFEHLHQLHSLSCRCSRSSTLYSSFLNVSTRSHQVCSSNFTSANWWKLLASRGDETFTLLDQPLLSNHFRMLSSFCTLSSQTIKDAITTFMSSTFVSVEVLTRTQFNDQIDSLLKNLIEQIPINFGHPFTHIIDTFRANQLTHLFLSNWMIAFSSAAENYILSNKPLSYNNGTCTCATVDGSSCWWPLTFLSDNQTNLTLPGLRGGCLPVDGLRQSTLECLYDERCLATIRSLMNTTFTPSIPATVGSQIQHSLSTSINSSECNDRSVIRRRMDQHKQLLRLLSTMCTSWLSIHIGGTWDRSLHDHITARTVRWCDTLSSNVRHQCLQITRLDQHLASYKTSNSNRAGGFHRLFIGRCISSTA